MLTNNNIQISANKVVVGELSSISMLNEDIAQHYLAKLKSTRLRPSARKSNSGWISCLENEEGTMLLFSDCYPSQELAQSKADEANRLLK